MGCQRPIIRNGCGKGREHLRVVSGGIENGIDSSVNLVIKTNKPENQHGGKVFPTLVPASSTAAPTWGLALYNCGVSLWSTRHGQRRRGRGTCRTNAGRHRLHACYAVAFKCGQPVAGPTARARPIYLKVNSSSSSFQTVHALRMTSNPNHRSNAYRSSNSRGCIYD